MAFIYSWVPAYQQIAIKIGDFRSDHLGLINILRLIGVEGFEDKEANDQPTQLDDIDPFTFLAYLNKYGDEKRINILKNLCSHWNIDVKIFDVCGIPSTNAQKVWLFPYKFDRNNNEIERLWELYNSVMADTVTNDQLNDIHLIRSVGWTKISEGLFMLKPEVFLPLNGAVNPYLSSLGIIVNQTSFTGIQQTCQSVQEKTNKPFYQVSYEGWLYSESLKRKPRFWRIGTKAGDHGKDILPEMIANDVASIGWNNLGNFRDIIPFNKTELQRRLSVQNYKGNNNVASRKAGEIINFVNAVKLNDFIIAMDGAQVRAIGKVLYNGYIYNPDLDFPNCRAVEWLDSNVRGLSFEEGLRTTLTEITTSLNIEKIRKYMSLSNTAPGQNDKENKQPLNQILYGPPGTGKTFKTTEFAMSILEGGHPEDFSTTNANDQKALQQKFNTYIKSGRAAFATFHQSYSYEDFVIGIKPDLEGGYMSFKRHEGIFYKICQRARENYLKSISQQVRIQISFEELLDEVLLPLMENKPVIVPNKTDGKEFQIVKRNSLNLDFIKHSGGSDHNLSIKTIKDLFEGTRTYRSNGLGPYFHSFVDYLKTKAKELTDTIPQEPIQNYVLIVDEINRANISRVLGELITLLEPDKRLGGIQELEINLSNGENFSVPPNLYIIGTMNTADKSIALLDIALRRRFVFRELLPDPEKISDPAHKSFFNALNHRVFKQKGKDFLIGHSYFMSNEETSVDLVSVMNYKVIPLLAEYFYKKEDEMINLVKEAIQDSDLRQQYVANPDLSGFNKLVFELSKG